ncbi:hypothetical protein EI94DRAFT_1237101 [Lactarius quietus]|nr:hypothetical protein EI94DRAFT_1237101 [Lactarius quietus]
MSFTRKTWYFRLCLCFYPSFCTWSVTVITGLRRVCECVSHSTALHFRLTYFPIGNMLPDPQSPLLSSPGEESTNSARMHSSPGPRSSDPGAVGSLGSAPDCGKPRTRTVAAILCDASTPFDRSSCIVTPFDNEAIRDMEFYQNLKDKQLEILSMMNSWVFSRLVAENEKAGESLASKMDAVAEAEGEQGRSLLSRFLLPCLPGTHAPRSESIPFPSLGCDWILSLWVSANFFFVVGVAERVRRQLESCVSNIRAALATLSRAVM